MRKLSLICISILVFAASSSSAQDKKMEHFVGNLMARMTLDEKIGQLNLLPGDDVKTGEEQKSQFAAKIRNGELGAILNVKGYDKIKALQDIALNESRLGIPLLVGLDVIHGYETVLPIPLAQACSWHPEVVELGAQMAAEEASAQGINWTYSPMVDVAHDPRWGRVAEGYGEDPYLSSVMGAAAVRGYQGANNKYGPQRVMACLKHYALYGAVEAGKDYTPVDMSRLRMYNQYLPPYKAAVEAGVGSVMSSFNIVDYVPATGNRWLLTDVLRQQWGFSGFVVTDYASISEMKRLGYGDLKVSAAQALKAGTDMDMCSSAYSKHLKQLVNEGTVSMEQVDEAVRHILEAKYKLGLFEKPYRYGDDKRIKTNTYSETHRKLARDIAAETFVLLKNDNHLLPLAKQGTIALIGPLADTRDNILGCWSTGDNPKKYATIKESMQQYLGSNARIVYAQGCNIYSDSVRQRAAEFGRPLHWGNAEKMLEEAVQTADKADVIVACLGEMAEMTGESCTRTDLSLPDVQTTLLQRLIETGKPVVLLNFSGRATAMEWESEHVPAIMNVWFGGSETGNAICDVLFGDKSPTGKLVNTMPRNTGQVPIFYNHINSSRPVPDGNKVFRKYQSNYIDTDNGPLYPFGYGLSYTTYSYSDVVLSSASMTKDGHIKASVMVTNTGDRDGDEVVQMYIRDRFSTILRPVKELKGFQRVHIAKGETASIAFDIDASTLQYLDSEGNAVLEEGDFDIMIGPDSKNVKTASLSVQ